MPRRIITLEEAAFLVEHRAQIARDNKDWAAEPFIAMTDVAEMSVHVSRRILTLPYWQFDEQTQVYRNTRHPDNAKWVEQLKAIQTLRDIGSVNV